MSEIDGVKMKISGLQRIYRQTVPTYVKSYKLNETDVSISPSLGIFINYDDLNM